MLELGMSLQIIQKQEIKLELGLVTKIIAICPDCNHRLSDKEVKDGFSNNPYDFETTCPECGRKFESIIVASRKAEEYHFIHKCLIQTQKALEDFEKEYGRVVSRSALEREDPGLYFNTIYHFGTLEKGLEKSGCKVGNWSRGGKLSKYDIVKENTIESLSEGYKELERIIVALGLNNYREDLCYDTISGNITQY